MHAIVSLLDDKYYQIVEKLWADLEIELGVRGVYVTPFPHFSYQLAQYYDLEEVKAVLQEFARTTFEFKVKTTGLGLFNGSKPVVFIPVIRSQALSQFQAQLCSEISRWGTGINAYYEAANWTPHITIGFGDVTPEKLGSVMDFLNNRDFNWEIDVNNLAFIYNTGAAQELLFRFNLAKGF